MIDKDKLPNPDLAALLKAADNPVQLPAEEGWTESHQKLKEALESNPDFMVDYVRMRLGEVRKAQAAREAVAKAREGVIRDRHERISVVLEPLLARHATEWTDALMSIFDMEEKLMKQEENDG